MAEKYKVFISYSWGENRQTWVVELAYRLMTEYGVDVVLDVWDLKEGQDKDVFMERMVNDDDVQYVLIVCDKNYQMKADSRSGGVGIETQIITPNLYGKVKETKFIPILAEKGETFTEFVPAYLRSRNIIDMSSEDVYEEGLEQLLRAISNQPKFPKPELKGKIPDFTSNDIPIFSTTRIVKNARNQIDNGRDKNILRSFEKFKDAFVGELEKMRLSSSDFTEPLDEIIYKKIEIMKPLRNDYIHMINLVSSLDGWLEYNLDSLVDFLSEIYRFHDLLHEDHQAIEIQYDHFRFLIYEVFLYTISVLLKRKKYASAGYLLSTKYPVLNYGVEKLTNFTLFNSLEIQSLENRNKRLGKRLFSLQASLLIERSNVDGLDFKSSLVNTDLILHYIAEINGGWWFPRTYVYYRHSMTFPLYRHLKSKYNFTDAIKLFGVDNETGMKEWLVRASKIDNRGYNASFNNIPGIQNFIKPEEICSFA